MNGLAKSRHTSWIFKPHFRLIKIKIQMVFSKSKLTGFASPFSLNYWTDTFGSLCCVHPLTSWAQRRPPSRLPVADQGDQFSPTKQEQKGTSHLWLRPWQPQRGPLALLPSLGKYGASLWRWQSRRLRLLESLNYLGEEGFLERPLGPLPPGPGSPAHRGYHRKPHAVCWA